MARRRRSERPTSDATLTPAQERAFAEVQSLIQRRHIPPTMAELGASLQVSAASAHELVGQLVRKGYLARQPGKSRSLSVLRSPPVSVGRLVAVPLLGVVQAGMPVLADENVIGEVLIDEQIARRGRCFGLRVSGESMLDAGMEDGDVVIVRQQQVAENGEIVVALVDGESTVKRLHMGTDRIELRPENSRFKPISIGPDTDLRILGKVVAVCRSPET